jgi:hypothetical protein
MSGACTPFGPQTQYLQKVAMSQKRRTPTLPSFGGAYNFTDLAQIVCKVNNYDLNSDDGDDSYEDDDDYGQVGGGGYASEQELEPSATIQKVLNI